MVEVRKLPTGGWRVWKFYPNAKGSKCRGWINNDGPDLRTLVRHALLGVEAELVRRGEARLPKVKSRQAPIDSPTAQAVGNTVQPAQANTP